MEVLKNFSIILGKNTKVDNSLDIRFILQSLRQMFQFHRGRGGVLEGSRSYTLVSKM